MKTVYRARLAQGAEVLAQRVQQQTDTATPHCDVLIVGSGYGGAVAAARFAGASVDDGHGGTRKARVWLLERGKERLPGSFVSRFGELPGDVRFSRQDGRPPRGAAEGLFDVRIGDDVQVLLASGLGGGSLINAGVMARPKNLPGGDAADPRSLHEARTRGDINAAYAKAEAMLGAAPLPADRTLAKLDAFADLAARGGVDTIGRCAATVAFTDDKTVDGVALNACTHCGDCMTGCNQGAKKSLDTTYLARARRGGAELFCGGTVARLARDGRAGLWIVDWHYTSPHKRPPSGAAYQLRARCVVLAAGALGSTEILLRSRPTGLSVSECLGAGFSTNGDQVAAVFRQRHRVHAVGDEDVPPGLSPGEADGDGARDVGPTITGLARAVAGSFDVAIEEFAVPAPLRRLFGEVTTSFGLVHGLFDGTWKPHATDEADNEDPLAVTTSSLEHTQVIGMMGDDGARGRLELRTAAAAQPATDGQIAVRWPKDPGEPLAQVLDAQLDWLDGACGKATAGGALFDTLAVRADAAPVEAGAIDGTVVPNPLWRALPRALGKALGTGRGRAMTVHPLGGCAIGDDGAHGVVDVAGCVYSGAGKDIHEGLAVLDGAIVPRALGINPALTIAALAEHAVPHLATHWKLKLAGDPPPTAALPPAAAQPAGWEPCPDGATAVRIREQMHGAIEIDGTRYWARLEVPQIDIDDLAACLRHHGRRTLPFATGKRAPCLELRPWRDDVPAFDGIPRDGVIGTATLSGTLELLAPLPKSGDAETGFATLFDVLACALDRLRGRGVGVVGAGELKVPPLEQLLQTFEGLIRGRALVYRLHVHQWNTPAGAAGTRPALLPPGTEIVGRKRLTFAKRSNPWRQWMELALERVAADGTPVALGLLETDLAYFARFRDPLVSLQRQRDHPSGLADLAALGLVVARAAILTHWPHFIPPGDMPEQIASRRPGVLDGRTPQHLALDDGAMLSRYTPERRAPGSRPVLLIHGLSAAGSTFAHPSIPKNLVRFLRERGRDVWLLDLRTSSANEPKDDAAPRPGPYTFEDAALADIPRAVDKIIAATGDAKVDVVAHCVGALMFCLAVLRHPSLHRSIAHAALSQVGPVAEMSPFNRARGMIASFLQDYLEVDELDTRPGHRRQVGDSWIEEAAQTQHLQALDALLATFPYPEDDQESERADALTTLPRKPRDFRTVRHRADAIFGQLFHLENLADETLLALDAIFGWVKTRTLAQTIHLARQMVLTDADGINRSTSPAMLTERMAFPVLLLHGQLNRVFDWRGSRHSYELLKSVFDEPIGENSARDGNVHLGAGTARQFLLLRRYGHQDTMIGKHACSDVFPAIDRFFDETPASRAGPPMLRSRFSCEQPWMGPMIGHTRRLTDADDGAAFEVSLLVHAGPRRAETLCVVVVPVDRFMTADGEGWRPHIGDAWGVRLVPCDTDIAAAAGTRGDLRNTRLRRDADVLDAGASAPDQRDLLLAQAVKLRLFAPPTATDLSYAVLLLHRDLQDGSTSVHDYVDPPPAAGAEPPEWFDLSRDALQAVQRALDMPAKRGETVFTLSAAALAAADQERPSSAPAALSFALASCQFPRGVFDRHPAGASYARLNAVLQATPGADQPGFLLLLGDQVYLDALANVFEAPGVAPGDIVRRAYELNWRLGPLRDVRSRVPVLAMLDDHEVRDNWQPGAGDATDPIVIAALRGWHFHQGKLNPPTPPGASLTYEFAPGGVPFFVLDTRSRREPRSVDGAGGGVAASAARLIPCADRDRLQAWLVTHRKAPVKFIASPSVVFPFDVAEVAPPTCLASDSWSGWPASLCDLLGFIDKECIGGVVFLGGDVHASLVARLTLNSGVEVHSIVSSGTYTPWPFANARAQDLAPDGAVSVSDGERRVVAIQEMEALLPADTAMGYATVAVEPRRDGSTRVHVTLPGDGGQRATHFDLPAPTSPATPRTKPSESDAPRAVTTPAAAAIAAAGAAVLASRQESHHG